MTRNLSWRLVLDGPVDGATNMALDRAVLLAHEAGEMPPTVRLYRWSAPTASIGRFQDAASVDLEAAEQAGVAVVRRPTGGRGVLHDDEVTYSIVAGVRDGVPSGTSASYRWICGALVAAFAELGVDAALTPRSSGDRGSAACYLHSTPADLSLGAAKLSGSAQLWHHESVLQHGSFVISRDVDLEARIFGLDARKAAELAASTMTLEGALGRRPLVDEVERAAILGFAEGLGVDLEGGPIPDDVRSWASEQRGCYVIQDVRPSI